MINFVDLDLAFPIRVFEKQQTFFLIRIKLVFFKSSPVPCPLVNDSDLVFEIPSFLPTVPSAPGTGTRGLFDDRPRNFEAWSNDEDDTCSDTPSPNYHTNGRTFELSIDLTCITPLHGRCRDVIHYRERKLLSGIGVSDKAGKVSKTANSLGVCVLRGPLKTSERFLLWQLSSDLFSVWFGNSSKRSSTRRRFVEWAQNEIAVVPDFHKRILFSDEAHFWLNGYINKQNCRIWSEANPQVYVETPLHPEKLTVWCALWAGGILL
ncbi:hypothetical protein TNCV_3519071 [Trichonephila clavipes]|uniref:Transposase n=1 Tax=Trichonephila clavipes TaxID=2585209 RepID=A0A8X6SPH5_TRICX|nr:hypothetical protein TNCV_3519071 [Trichonephila clavipes]